MWDFGWRDGMLCKVGNQSSRSSSDSENEK